MNRVVLVCIVGGLVVAVVLALVTLSIRPRSCSTLLAKQNGLRVFISGRAGNRMFELAAARSMAAKQGKVFPLLKTAVNEVGLWNDKEKYHYPSSGEKLPFGYYQDWRFIEDVKDELARALPRDETLRDVIGLHIRGGDYFKYPGTFYFLDETYYSKALLALPPNKPVVVFTNDRKHATALMKKLDVDWEFSSGASPQEDFKQLASCAHVITANSTFSWMAGWLANYWHDSAVVIPFKWFKHDNSYDFFHPNFTVVA